MRYVEFRDAIARALGKRPAGMTWVELREAAELPYERPCPEWTRRLEAEIGLERTPPADRSGGRRHVWTLKRSQPKRPPVAHK